MENKKTGVAVLGATGSIGQNTAEILHRLSDRFNVIGIVGKRNLEELARQSALLHPDVTITADPKREQELAALLPPGRRMASGPDAVLELVTSPEVDVVVCAIVGISGVGPVLAALRAGKRVALASKEVLVMAGDIVMAEAEKSPGGDIIPVDSEHSAIFQCLAGRDRAEVARLWLTSSGGPFREWSSERIANATLADALDHPVWDMGVKITVDSASMMNKALELIEARHLFGFGPDQMDVTVNPSSVVHSFVELADHSLIAQLGAPDMRLPIQYALTFPERLEMPGTGLDLAGKIDFRFEPPDRKKFRSLDLADAAMRRGGTMPAVLNAANDIAVERFRRGEVPFSAIWKIVEEAMTHFDGHPEDSIDGIRAVDSAVRDFAAGVKA